MKFGHKPSFASSKQFLVATVKMLANNCTGYNGQKSKNRDFQTFLMKWSFVQQIRCIKPIFDTDFSSRIDW